ncbi:hypothetical protein SDC9_105089 [bioreactor metagenome]|uniref:Uncharacterized protein n=1 Tax=bioreactor metagenome TaxID=1076179 RepID=A0A645AZP2_9ZZZZ
MAARIIGAVSFHPGGISVAQTNNELMCLGDLGRCHHLRIAGIGFAPTNVFSDGARKKKGFLRHQSNLLTQGFESELLKQNAIQFDLALAGLIEAGDEVDQGRFTRPGSTNDAHRLTRLDFKRNIGQSFITGWIVAKADMIKLEQGNSGTFCGRQAALAFFKGGLCAQHFADPLG